MVSARLSEIASLQIWQLSNQLLRRDEIWFVEKDERGVSTLYSLADFVEEDGSHIRKDESYEKNYLIVTDTEAAERCFFTELHRRCRRM